MLITVELLKEFNACEAGIKYVERFYPDGVEMIDLIKDKHIPKEMLHWGRAHLTHSAEDLKAYCAACNIVNTKSFWYSENIIDSNNVVKSNNVESSTGIFNSKDVGYSTDVVGSEIVDGSDQIYSCEMVGNSKHILHSKNVNSCINVCHSTTITNSKNVYLCHDVFDSSEIIESQRVTDSHFCTGCSDIKNCMFCFDLHEAEYHIFNQPVTKERFELFARQYGRFMDVELNFIKDEWPTAMVAGIIPQENVYGHWYEPISDRFWKWAKTLSGYDAVALYIQTMLPRFILED